MRRSLVMRLLVSALALTLSGPATASDSKHASVAIASKFAEAINNKDASKAASLYDENAVMMPPGNPAVKGRAAIEAYWKQALENGVSDLKVMPFDSSVSGTLGYEALNYELSAGTGDKKIYQKGKSMIVVRRSKDGQWRMVYDVWNDDGAPAQ